MKYNITPTTILINIWANGAAGDGGEVDIASTVPMNVHVLRAVIEGALPVPLDLILPLADRMKQDRAFLFHMWLRDYAPEIDSVMRNIVGDYFADAERELLIKADEILTAVDLHGLLTVTPIIEHLIAIRQHKD